MPLFLKTHMWKDLGVEWHHAATYSLSVQKKQRMTRSRVPSGGLGDNPGILRYHFFSIHLTILSPCLFNLYAEYIMRNVGWKKHKLESTLPGEISIISDMQMTPPLWQKAKN